jgi:endo-1,4-beta-xylanase
MPDRREFLAMAAAMGLMPLPSLADSAGSAPDSLNGLAAAKGMGFGSCLGGSPEWPTSAFASTAMRRLMIEQCGILVPENELKWQALRPSAKSFDFSRADALIGFAVKNGMRVRGHTLLWQKMERFPQWLATYDFGSDPAKEAERLLGEHVATVCGHYGPAIFTYDVVNETVDEKTGELRETVLTKAMGQAVVPYMFEAARVAAPNAKLVYNDYMSWGAWSAKHRDGVLRLLEGLKKANVPIDALGIQSHIGADANGGVAISSADQAEWRRFLDEVTGMGLDLAITEFDVNDRSLPADIAVRDAGVAALARDYLDMMMSYKQLQYVMAWGLVDKYSWLQGNTPRKDGLPKRSLPYDDDYKPTPLRGAIADAFRAAPSRA